MKYCKLIFAIVATFFLVACPSEYAPECGTKTESSSSEPTEESLVVHDVTFDSLSLLMSAEVNAADGTEITAVCNGKSQTAVSVDGKICWNMVTSFYNGIKGGKEYEVAYTASSGHKGTVKNKIGYWPKASYTLLSSDDITIYNGSAKTYQPPKYSINYDVAKVSLGMTFKVYDKDGTKTSEHSYPDWTIVNMLDFLSEIGNDGCSVEVHFKVTPTCSDGENLAAGGYVTYHCKKDVLVKSAYIVNDYGNFEVHLYAGDMMDDDSEGETAGGIVSYQWQFSDDAVTFDNLIDQTGKTFSLTNENVENLLGKTLRVQITQTYEGVVRDSIYSTTYPVYHKVAKYDLHYDGVLAVGGEFDTSKIKGTVTDELGKVHDEHGWWILTNELYENGYYTAVSSKMFMVGMLKNGFYDGVAEIYAIVQSVLAPSEIPAFSTDTYSISVGKVEFASVNHNLEISYNAGATYEAFPNDEFAAEVGQVLYIRKKAVGTPNANGYIKESEPQTVTVEAEHLGRKTNGGGIIDELKQFDLTLTKTTSAAGVTITPVMNYTLSGIKTECTWLIDNVNALSYSGVSVSENGIYMNYSDFYKDESYQVNCQVRLWAEDADGNEIASRIISAQVSVKVK